MPSALRTPSVLRRIRPVARLELYVHVAFCEFLCPFCHYDTAFAKIGAREPERVRRYVAALISELARWRERLGASMVGSLYIGGGTPTATSESHLLGLIDAVGNFGKTSDYL